MENVDDPFIRLVEKEINQSQSCIEAKMTVKLIPEIFQQLSQQVDTARESLQKVFDNEYGTILKEHLREKEELTLKIDLISKDNLEVRSILDKELKEKKELERELIKLQELSSSYAL